MGNHKALILAVIITMLAAATTAQAYYEKWSGFFATGTITYSLKTYTFSPTGSSGSTVCHSGDVDTFLVDSTSFVAYFINNEGTPDTLILTGTTYSSHSKFSGIKGTGQSGTKEGSGTWCASTNKSGLYIWGTWDTDGAGTYFDYNSRPPVAGGNWDVSGGTYSVSGGGTIYLERASTW